MSTTIAERLDVRSIPPRERHPTIFNTFERLQPGSALELVNDHDPAPLRMQFQSLMPGTFEWSYAESGPDTWRVHITKLARRDHCCGGCCGS